MLNKAGLYFADIVIRKLNPECSSTVFEEETPVCEFLFVYISLEY